MMFDNNRHTNVRSNQFNQKISQVSKAKRNKNDTVADNSSDDNSESADISSETTPDIFEQLSILEDPQERAEAFEELARKLQVYIKSERDEHLILLNRKLEIITDQELELKDLRKKLKYWKKKTSSTQIY